MTIPAQLSSYLAWINKVAPTGVGDAFLGGLLGLPSPFPPYFDVTNPLFGAKGDSKTTTDDSVPINAALTAAYNAAATGSTIAVFIPPAAPQSNGAPGFYNLKQPLLIYHGSKLIGAEGGQFGVKLQWNADCNGIDVQNGGASLTGDVCIRNLYLSGNAVVSAVSTKTIGINSYVTNFWDIQNVYVQNFVDQLVFDAGTVGNGLHFVYNFITYNTSYPNATNGYPRYGVRLTGSGNTKPQSVEFRSFFISGILSANSATFTGNGSATTFNLKPNSPLWQESGIKVYYQNGGGHNVKKSSAGGSPDYQLYDFTTGSNVLIPNGSSGSKSQNVNVIFTSAPANGQSILIMFNDPNMQVGILNEGNINSFEGGGIQGCITGVDDTLGGNLYAFDNMEIIDTAWQLNGVRTIALSRAYNNTVDSLFTSSTGKLITSQQGAGWDWTEAQATVTTGTQTFTSATPTVIAFDGVASGKLSFAEYDFTNREVEVQIPVGLVATGGGPVHAQFTVQVSYDNDTTYSSLGVFDVSGYCSSSSEIFYVPVRQSFIDRSSLALPVGYGVPNIYYRTKVALIAGTNVQVIPQDGSGYYALRVRDVNLAVG